MLPIMLGNGIPILYRSEAVEVQITNVTNAGTQFTFPDNQILRTAGAKVYALEAFVATQQTIAPSGLPVITLAGSLGLNVTLQDKRGANRVNASPYYTFIAALNGGYLRMMKPFEIVLTNSNVKTTAVAGITLNDVAFFNFWYYTPEDEEIFYQEMKEGDRKRANMSRG